MRSRFRVRDQIRVKVRVQMEFGVGVGIAVGTLLSRHPVAGRESRWDADMDAYPV